MQTTDKTLEFMQIAMKYIPEAKQQLDGAGIELSLEMIQPFMTLFTKVMTEAYEMGKADAIKEME
ncbi:ComZ family protein [Cytobacillus solani]|uniref:Competence protein ComG n=1 Tax=Cytobacillus solani TaxID=1637975 RepID=A0A0Q3QLR7_9BACI|nr:ComZ family protein [Cytobacillus solani]KOP81725.1 competence protein ComG [Bacillus sp. FJAT-21945]KQL18662.1 competence protein ComG [Cytobacillus solani]USK56647.1 ComZ family protein [Cytobacillus solani]